MSYSSESSAQEYATTISQLITSVTQTHSGRHQLLAVVKRISVGILGCVWFDGYPWMGDGSPWTSGVWFAGELDMDIHDRGIA